MTPCFVYNGNGVAIGEGIISVVGYEYYEVGVKSEDDISGRHWR